MNAPDLLTDEFIIGKEFRKAKSWGSPRCERDYLMTFHEVPMWAVPAFVAMIKDFGEAVRLEDVRVSVSLKATTCTLSSKKDYEMRSLLEALKANQVEAEIELLEQRLEPSLCEMARREVRNHE